MKFTAKALLACTCMTLSAVSLGAQTLTIATVNNSDMIRMQKLSKTFETEHPEIKLNWVVLEENVLRQRLTTDIATQGGQFDVLTIGMYEAALWGAKGWLEPMKDLPASYDLTTFSLPCVTAFPSRARCTPCRSTPKAPSPTTAPTCSRTPG